MDKIFLRNTSGLVKSAKGSDVLFFNLGLISVGIAVTLAHFFVPAYYNGASLVWAEIFAGVFMAIIAFCFFCWTIAIPRSGGAYSFVSRGVHPVIGFSVSFIDTMVWLFYNTFAATFIVTIGISPMFFALGLHYDSRYLLDLSIILQKPLYLFIISASAIVLSGALLVWGMKYFYTFQKIMLSLAILGTVTAIFVLQKSSTSEFISSFDNAFKNYFDDPSNTIASFSEDSFRFSIKATILASVWPILSFVGSVFSVNIASEIQNVKKSQIFGMFGSIIIAVILMTLLSYSFTSVVSSEFQSGLTNYYFYELTGLPIAPYFSTIVAIVAKSPIYIVMICLGFMAWAFLWLPATLTYSARAILAWSFDRLAPSKIGFVHQKRYTPVNAIFTVVVLNVLFLILFLFVPFFNSLVLVLTALIAWLPIMVGAIIFPYWKRNVYRQTPIYGKNILGIPLITISGILGFLAVIFLIYLLFNDEVAAGPNINTLGTVIVFFALSFSWYFVMKRIRKRKDNIDISRAFDEIPID